MRKITVSCPGCHTEFRLVAIDEAERVLFHGCVTCRAKLQTFSFRGSAVSKAPEE